MFSRRCIGPLARRRLVRGTIVAFAATPPKARELYEKADAEDEYGDTRTTFEDVHPQGLGEQPARGDALTGAQGDW